MTQAFSSAVSAGAVLAQGVDPRDRLVFQSGGEQVCDASLVPCLVPVAGAPAQGFDQLLQLVFLLRAGRGGDGKKQRRGGEGDRP